MKTQMDFMELGGNIVIKATCEGQWCTVVVKNLEKIFETVPWNMGPPPHLDVKKVIGSWEPHARGLVRYVYKTSPLVYCLYCNDTLTISRINTMSFSLFL